MPRACFVDLESLFERAVRRMLGRVLPDDEVDRGEPFDRWMFTGGLDASRTHPDLVVHRDGVPRMAGDVKYKNLRVGLGERSDDEESDADVRRRKEGRQDLYQVLVHAASLGVDRAFLIYVSDDKYESRYLGALCDHLPHVDCSGPSPRASRRPCRVCGRRPPRPTPAHVSSLNGRREKSKRQGRQV